MIVLLDELKNHEETSDDEKTSVYTEFSSNLDLFYLNYKNILRYFTKLISIKFYRVKFASVFFFYWIYMIIFLKVFEKNKEKLISLNDELKANLIVLMQIYPSTNVYNWLFESLMAKKEFKFLEFFKYIFGIFLATR